MGNKTFCPHCGKLVITWIRVISNIRLYKPNKANIKELSRKTTASQELRNSTSVLCCPECHQKVWCFLDTAIEVRYTPLSDFNMEEVKEPKTKKRKIRRTKDGK